MNGEAELWRLIPGYEGRYMVSSYGRVASKRKSGYRLLTLHTDLKGYAKVTLSKDGRLTTFRVHRLVAQAFIPNPDLLPEVNHRNEVRTDNRACNLEWCDRCYNINYGDRTDRHRMRVSKPVLQFSLAGDFMEAYSSGVSAERATGIKSSGITACCRGERQSAGQCLWAYVGGTT